MVAIITSTDLSGCHGSGAKHMPGRKAYLEKHDGSSTRPVTLIRQFHSSLEFDFSERNKPPWSPTVHVNHQIPADVVIGLSSMLDETL